MTAHGEAAIAEDAEPAGAGEGVDSGEVAVGDKKPGADGEIAQGVVSKLVAQTSVGPDEKQGRFAGEDVDRFTAQHSHHCAGAVRRFPGEIALI